LLLKNVNWQLYDIDVTSSLFGLSLYQGSDRIVVRGSFLYIKFKSSLAKEKSFKKKNDAYDKFNEEKNNAQ
jgi:hypothetical protein